MGLERIKNIDLKIETVRILEDVSKNNKLKTVKRLLINNNYILQSSDEIEFICDECNQHFSSKFLYKSKFFEEKILCGSCHSKKIKFEKYGNKNYNNREKAKQTNIKKYGVDNIWKDSIIIDRIKTLKKYKYGSFNNIEKIKKTNIKKYGVDNPWKNNECRKKGISTSIKKYGNHNNIEKTKQTNIEKYGVINTFQLEKSKETLMRNYHVSHPSYSKEIQKRISRRKLELFYNQLINSDRLKKMVQPLFSFKEYSGTSEKDLYKWKCCKCNNIFEDVICNGLIPRCPNCYPKIIISSKSEKEVADWIKSLNVQIDENNRTIINPLELDIYIPSHNLAIEFDGLYWHSELNGKDSNYHLDKTNRCIEKCIHLLHIFEDEWIEKQDIIKSIIKNNLGLHDTIVYGRNCTVKEISSKEANEFYDTNHIQGSCTSSINLGLFYENELVSCLSFAKPRFNKKYDWEITRFANKLFYKVYGSFGKLWKHKPIGTIITYSDKRLFTGSVYKKYMTQLVDSKPAYWYVKNGIRHSRLEFQKHKLQKKLESYDVSLTEWENMQLNGYDRIWDCGNWVFESK